MQNTFKAHMIRTYSHNELADMANHGATAGYHGLIWTNEVLSLYTAHSAALHEILAEYKDNTGEFPEYVTQFLGDVDQFQSAVVYFAAEWVAYELTQGEYQEQALEA